MHPLSPEDVAQLRKLEECLLQEDVRRSPERIGAILADEFTEHGMSGGVWSKADVLAAADRLPHVELPLQEFEARAVSSAVALVTYRSVTIETDGTRTPAVRSSMWVRAGDSWKLALHQGTPSEEKRDSPTEG